MERITVSALDNYAESKRAFMEDLEERSTQLGDAARGSQAPSARQWLQSANDATSELLSFLKSPALDQIIETFHKSPAERAKAAAMDMCAYFADAGLECSPNATWQLHDNNWCLGGQVSVHSGRDVIVVGGHYDSDSGWGAGGCPDNKK
jgi:hypothetical protein